MKPPGIRVADRPDGHHVLLGVELQAVRAQRGVEVDGELRDAQYRPVDAHQRRLEPVRRRITTRRRGRGRGPATIEQRAAVHLDRDLPQTGPAGIGRGLTRRVGLSVCEPSSRKPAFAGAASGTDQANSEPPSATT